MPAAVRAVHSIDVSSGRSPGFAGWRKELSRAAAFLPWARKYEHPQGRSGFIIEELAPYIHGTILDVGAGRNATVFAQAFGDAYHPLDIGGSYHVADKPNAVLPETVVDLERGGLPFPDGSFDTVFCTDVLEHIDNIYNAYDELFRVARKSVIISLPNNWVKYPMSFLRGTNVTHKAGYGLPPQPKGVGERHKYFFNLEEAADFLTGRTPQGFRPAAFEPRFEYGTDGVLCGVQRFSYLVRGVEMRRLLHLSRRELGERLGTLVAMIGIPVYAVLRPIDVIISALLWGFGSPVRFYNLFCRQVWVVFEKVPASEPPA
ncbi:class I SAM-dependent methyltransferase [Sphingomonas sp.]|jgi:hypothetical protein|uniref:class I SAM-dependent methyltransferase n=1 Tax=Sphingomonas sp. TaxID=28214 RepID=UPI002DF0919E|nr:methyltransferase domain-containing protein [Sphingomonas sp.]HEV2568127.1 methyltransferase domain-containing protein [Sphingomonas sp.]